MIDQDVVQNPADMSDPQAQQKIAAGILSQLGLHPDQQGARSLLDMHFQGPTANPEVAKTIAPLVHNPESTALPANPVPPVKQPTETSTSLINPGTPTMPTPSAASRTQNNTENRTTQDQNELGRLIRTGSGVSQIHNPFLKTLATVGDTAAGIMFPRAEQLIPGGEGHHNALVQNEKNLVNTDLGQQATEAKTAQTQAETANSRTLAEREPNELATWIRQNPGKPIEEYWTEKTQGGKLSPEQQTMRYYTTPTDKGGLGMNPGDALKKINEDKQAGKPPTTASAETQFQSSLAKVFKNGSMNPNVLTDPAVITSAITNSSNLTPEEKSSALAHLASKTSPASQGGVARVRGSMQMTSRLTPAIDSTTGALTLVNPQEVNANPGRYIPATQGAQALTKEAGFAELNRVIDLTHDSLTGLKTPFSTEQRAKMALALRSPDPQSAWDSFFHSSMGQTLTPDQADYATALASLNENAMALRSIQGLGQGSDQLRGAIHAMLPGPGTPNPAYAERQLNVIKAMMQTLKGGVPKTGVAQPTVPAVPKTGDNNPPVSKTFTKDQIQKVVDDYNQQHPDHKITYEDAKSDAVKHGHKVTE